MNKELLSTGKPYLWVLYYASFILFTLVFVSGFRFLPVGIMFFVMLLVKSYASNNMIMYLVGCYKFKDKIPLYKKQLKLNGAMVGPLLLMDVLLFIHLPEVLKQTYTLSALGICLLVFIHCFLNRWNTTYPATYAPEIAAQEIVFRKKR